MDVILAETGNIARTLAFGPGKVGGGAGVPRSALRVQGAQGPRKATDRTSRAVRFADWAEIRTTAALATDGTALRVARHHDEDAAIQAVRQED